MRQGKKVTRKPVENKAFMSVKDMKIANGPFLVVAEWFDAAYDSQAVDEAPQPALEDLQLTHTPGYLLGVTNPGTERACLVLGHDNHPKYLETRTLGQYHIPISIVWRVLDPVSGKDLWSKIVKYL